MGLITQIHTSAVSLAHVSFLRLPFLVAWIDPFPLLWPSRGRQSTRKQNYANYTSIINKQINNKKNPPCLNPSCWSHSSTERRGGGGCLEVSSDCRFPHRATWGCRCPFRAIWGTRHGRTEEQERKINGISPLSLRCRSFLSHSSIQN